MFIKEFVLYVLMTKEKFKVFEGVFDEFTLRTLETLKRKKFFDELGKPIKTGKEGDVYFAYKDDGNVLAVKIYRLTSANFKKISSYISRDHRFKNIRGNLRKVILRWCEKEFRNLVVCRKCNMSVPNVYKQYNNVIIMEYIEGGMLKDTELKNPKKFFSLLIEQIRIMRNDAKLIHGDLSEFNVLASDNIPVIIDWGSGISVRSDEDFREFYDLYERDIRNIVSYFNKRYNLSLDLESVIKMLE